MLALLRATVDRGERTLVMVTHDPSAAAWADRVVFMADGRLAGEALIVSIVAGVLGILAGGPLARRSHRPRPPGRPRHEPKEGLTPFM